MINYKTKERNFLRSKILTYVTDDIVNCVSNSNTSSLRPQSQSNGDVRQRLPVWVFFGIFC